MPRHRPGPGRPSAGPRRAILTRLPEQVADRVCAEADARNMSYSEYVALVVASAHGFQAALPPRLAEVPQQDSLDLQHGVSA